MTHSILFTPLNFSIKNYRTWLFATLFVFGNIVLPQICHLIPQGGLIFLPIYFFTLIAAYKFGLTAGLLTGILSPIVNSILFGMPMAAMLPIILIKSGILAILASIVAKKSKSISLLLVALVVIGYQLLGGVVEGLISQNMLAGIQDLRLGFPGILIQILGGWLILKSLAGYGK